MSQFQESLAREPFWLLVACALRHKADWGSARIALQTLRANMPQSWAIATATPLEIMRFLQPLALKRRRAKGLIAMAKTFIHKPPRTAADVLAEPGYGLLAVDCWTIFVDRRLDINPTDHVLQEYIKLHKSDDL